MLHYYKLTKTHVEDDKFKVELFVSDDERDHKYNNNTESDIVSIMDKDTCTGIVIRGDDPLSEISRNDVCSVLRTMRAIYGEEKNISLMTNLSLKDIEDINDEIIKEIFSYATLALQ